MATVPVQPKQVRSTNAFFTAASTSLPAVTALGNSMLTLTVSPKVAGDSLAIGEVITVAPSAALPSGMGIAYAIVTAVNTVQINLMALVAISASSRAWTVVAHR